MRSPSGTPKITDKTKPIARACRLMASAWKSCPETSSSIQTVTTLENGGNSRALPVRPAVSQISARVMREKSLRVLGFMSRLGVAEGRYIIQTSFRASQRDPRFREEARPGIQVPERGQATFWKSKK